MKKSIELLNKAVADELIAVHQYMYFHFHCDDQGLDLLASLFKKTAIDEMRHIEKLAERILFLNGDVEMNTAEKIQAVHDLKDMLAIARKMENESAKEYNEWANECASDSDAISKQIFEGLVGEEEKHFDQFDIEIKNIEKFGDSYLALQSIERSKNISTR